MFKHLKLFIFRKYSNSACELNTMYTKLFVLKCYLKNTQIFITFITAEAYPNTISRARMRLKLYNKLFLALSTKDGAKNISKVKNYLCFAPLAFGSRSGF